MIALEHRARVHTYKYAYILVPDTNSQPVPGRVGESEIYGPLHVCGTFIQAQALVPGCIPPLKEKETTLSTHKHANQEEQGEGE